MNRRVRNFVYSFMPFVMVIVIQLVASIFVGQIAGVMYVHNFHGDTFEEFFHGLLGNDFMNAVNFGIYFIYSVLSILFFGFYYYTRFYKTSHRRYDSSLVIAKAEKPSMSFRGYRWPLLVVGIFLAVIGMTIVVNYFMSAIAVVLPEWAMEFEELSESAGLDQISAFTIVYACILGPIAEELAFRGVTTEYLKRSMGFWGTCIIQALLFGIMHMNKMQSSYAFLVGLLLGYVYLKTGNIIITIILHIVYNSASSLTVFVPDQALELLNYAAVSFVVLVVGLAASYYGARILTKVKKQG